MASSWTESVSVLGGPALAALLLGVSGPGAVFAVMAFALACSGLLVTGVRTTPEARPARSTVRSGRFQPAVDTSSPSEKVSGDRRFTSAA